MSSVVTIEELTGKKRRLELMGTGVPFKGAPWGGETTLVTQFYPGNTQASQQVLAPKQSPSDWSGMWHTTLLLRDACQWSDGEGVTAVPIAYAHQLVEIFISIRSEAQRLRVTWATASIAPKVGSNTPQRQFKVVRIGRIGQFEFKPDTVDDIAWSATFVWMGTDDTPLKIQAVTPDLLALIQGSINTAQSVADLPKQNIRSLPQRFTLGQLEQMTQAPLAVVDSFARAATNLISNLRELGDIVIATRDVPASLYGRALDVATDAVGTSNNFIDQMSRPGRETLANRQKVSTLTRTLSYYSGAITQAQLLATMNTESKLQMARRRSHVQAQAGVGTAAAGRDIITIYTPKPGDTLQSISHRFYGADLSSALAKANGIKSYAIVAPKQPMIIPTKTALELLISRVS